jgi:hypothetical protein
MIIGSNAIIYDSSEISLSELIVRNALKTCTAFLLIVFIGKLYYSFFSLLKIGVSCTIAWVFPIFHTFSYQESNRLG